MKVFVTGGTGFIGSHTCHALLDAGHTVKLFVRNKAKAKALFGTKIRSIVVGDIASAERELANIRRTVNLPNVDEHRVGPASVSRILTMAAHGLEGEIKQSQGDLDGAISAFSEAVAMEDGNPYTEPPDWAQPLRHYLGAALMQAGRAEEAEAIYRRDLTWNQNNGWGLFGLWKSLEAQGKDREADAARVAFEDSWKNSDVTLASSRI